MKRKPDGKMHRAGRVLVQAGRVLTGKQMAGRNLTVFPDDVFLTSYPRSGNTWTRFLIGNLIYQDEPVTFANIESRLPEIYFNSDHYLRSLPRPRILKRHECFQPQYPRVIYIVRAPRDVAVSFYHHNVKAGNIADDYPMEAFIPRFIAAEFDARWGSWSDKRPELACTPRKPSRLHSASPRNHEGEFDPGTAACLRLSRTLRIPQDRQQPGETATRRDLSTPERMRDLEKAQSANWVLTKNTRSDKPFVRTAKARRLEVDAFLGVRGQHRISLGTADGTHRLRTGGALSERRSHNPNCLSS